MTKFPVQIMKRALFEAGKETKVSFEISLAGTTVENISLDDAKVLSDMLQNLIQVEKEVTHE